MTRKKERETTKINGKTNRNTEQKRVDETQKKKKTHRQRAEKHNEYQI